MATASFVAFLSSKNTKEAPFLRYLPLEETKKASVKLYYRIFERKTQKCTTDGIRNVSGEIQHREIDSFDLMQKRLKAYLDSDNLASADNLDIESAINFHSRSPINDKRIEILSYTASA